MYTVEWIEAEKSGYGQSVGVGRLRARSFESAQDAATFAAGLRSNVWVDISCVEIRH